MPKAMKQVLRLKKMLKKEDPSSKQHLPDFGHIATMRPLSTISGVPFLSLWPSGAVNGHKL